jgi:hypothetical protein
MNINRLDIVRSNHFASPLLSVNSLFFTSTVFVGSSDHIQSIFDRL